MTADDHSSAPGKFSLGKGYRPHTGAGGLRTAALLMFQEERCMQGKKKKNHNGKIRCFPKH